MHLVCPCLSGATTQFSFMQHISTAAPNHMVIHITDHFRIYLWYVCRLVMQLSVNIRIHTVPERKLHLCVRTHVLHTWRQD